MFFGPIFGEQEQHIDTPIRKEKKKNSIQIQHQWRDECWYKNTWKEEGGRGTKGEKKRMVPEQKANNQDLKLDKLSALEKSLDHKRKKIKERKRRKFFWQTYRKKKNKKFWQSYFSINSDNSTPSKIHWFLFFHMPQNKHRGQFSNSLLPPSEKVPSPDDQRTLLGTNHHPNNPKERSKIQRHWATTQLARMWLAGSSLCLYKQHQLIRILAFLINWSMVRIISKQLTVWKKKRNLDGA